MPGPSAPHLLALVSLALCVLQASAATCGDGLQEAGEQCEDGNQVRLRSHIVERACAIEREKRNRCRRARFTRVRSEHACSGHAHML